MAIQRNKVLTVEQTVQERKAKLLHEAMHNNWTQFFVVAVNENNAVVYCEAKGDFTGLLGDFMAANPQALRGVGVAMGNACRNISFEMPASQPTGMDLPGDHAELTHDDLEPPMPTQLAEDVFTPRGPVLFNGAGNPVIPEAEENEDTDADSTDE